MILYFDTFITDTPLNKKAPPPDNVREKSAIYAMPKKIDIAKYTLASYATYPWSHVYIKYELEDPSQIADFDRFVKGLFPAAIIEHERSDSKTDYLKSLETLEQMGDPWIFYAPNNDHPLLISKYEDIDYINKLLRQAESWMTKLPYVSVIYSHISEYVQASLPQSANHRYFGSDTIFLAEDQESITFMKPRGDFNSIQILHRDTLRKIFTSTNKTDNTLRRLEDVTDVVIPDHVIITPKRKLCAHFDGYEHMQGTINEIISDIEPVLFIPPGFFDKKIKIAYGYEKARPGHVNINPCAKRYSFRDTTYGTDLKISLGEIPLFWKDYMEKLDINPAVNHQQCNLYAERHYEKILNPWKISSRGLNLKNFIFQLKLFLRPILDRIGIMQLLRKN